MQERFEKSWKAEKVTFADVSQVWDEQPEYDYGPRPPVLTFSPEPEYPF